MFFQSRIRDSSYAIQFISTWVREDRSSHAKPLNNTPLFLATVSCLVVIMGESDDLGRNPSLDSEAKLAIISVNHERFYGET